MKERKYPNTFKLRINKGLWAIIAQIGIELCISTETGLFCAKTEKVIQRYLENLFVS